LCRSLAGGVKNSSSHICCKIRFQPSSRANNRNLSTLNSGPQGSLYSVYILIAFALREDRVIDRTADVKGKLQLTVF
jgi:hypothetical protein